MVLVHILLAPPARARIRRGRGVEVASGVPGCIDTYGRGGGGGADEVDLWLPRVATRAPDAGETNTCAHVPGMGKEEKDRRWIDQSSGPALFFQLQAE